MVYGLTPGQADCAKVIVELTQLHGRRPTYPEIGAELGIVPSSAFALVGHLGERGWARIVKGRAVAVIIHPMPPGMQTVDTTPIALTDKGCAAAKAAWRRA